MFILFRSDPLKCRSLHYDLVLNGQEIGGGSVRIHEAETQKYVIEQILGEDSSELNHLLKVNCSYLFYSFKPKRRIYLRKFCF